MQGFKTFSTAVILLFAFLVVSVQLFLEPRRASEGYYVSDLRKELKSYMDSTVADTIFINQ